MTQKELLEHALSIYPQKYDDLDWEKFGNPDIHKKERDAYMRGWRDAEHFHHYEYDEPEYSDPEEARLEAENNQAETIYFNS